MFHLQYTSKAKEHSICCMSGRYVSKIRFRAVGPFIRVCNCFSLSWNMTRISWIKKIMLTVKPKTLRTSETGLRGLLKQRRWLQFVSSTNKLQSSSLLFPEDCGKIYLWPVSQINLWHWSQFPFFVVFTTKITHKTDCLSFRNNTYQTVCAFWRKLIEVRC